MEQRVSMITLGVSDVHRAKTFYEWLGWQGQMVQQTVFFELGGLVLVLWGRKDLVADAGLEATRTSGFAGVVLAHNVRTPSEVDDAIGLAEEGGATVTRRPEKTFYGGYAGYFTDPDGHVWEVAHNPSFEMHEDGTITVPDFGAQVPLPVLEPASLDVVMDEPWVMDRPRARREASEVGVGLGGPLSPARVMPTGHG